jgi:hypothetical protein
MSERTRIELERRQSKCVDIKSKSYFNLTVSSISSSLTLKAPISLTTIFFNFNNALIASHHIAMGSTKLNFLSVMATLLYTTSVSAGVGYPEITSETRCDGLVRPTWADCEKLASNQLQGSVTAGPGFLAGTVFREGNCQVRFVACDPAAAEFKSDGSIVRQLMNIVKDSCGEGIGGAHRYGQACVVVEDPENNYSKRSVSRVERKRVAEIESAEAKREAEPTIVAKDAEAPYGENLESRQCNPPPNPCFTYTELTFVQNFRGDAHRVCENVLPDGAACTQTRATTVTQSLDVGVEFGGSIADIVTVGASFTQSSGTSNTETLATTITINCKDGEKKGYVVWYPYFEVSRGRCGKGTGGSCAGSCYAEEEKTCEMRRPIKSGFGSLTGEYGIVCI